MIIKFASSIDIMYAYAICRIQKIKTWADLSKSGTHNARQSEVLNADNSVNNVRLIDGDGENIIALFKAKIGNQTIRRNAVLGVEILLTVSPEYFRPDNPSQAGFYIEERLDKFASSCTQWLLDRYRDNVVRAELHLDESTPHIHAYIVPLDYRGKLNARALFSGRQKMYELQDSFAAAVKHLGIERGIKGSKAKHVDIKKYYASINCQSHHINLEEILPEPKEYQTIAEYREAVKEILQPQLEIVNHQISDRQDAINKKKAMEKTSIASERERRQLAERVQNLEWTLELWQSQANLLRDVPLEDVAYHLGLRPSKYQGRWEGIGHIIEITGSKFYDFVGKQQGGGGAIDLVMHLKNCSFRSAVAWLHETFGESETLGAVTYRARNEAQEIIATEKVLPFSPPVGDEKKWFFVKEYLTSRRKLPENLVNNLHSKGLIYSDEKQNAVFLLRSLTEEVTGAYLRGTFGWDNSFIAFAPGTKLSKGWFHITVGGKVGDKITRAILTKSPIELLSLMVLNHPVKERTIYIAVDSPRCLPLEFLSYMPKVIAAYDNDITGDGIYEGIKKVLPQTTRLTPHTCDWNQQLVQKSLQKKEL